MKKKNRQNQYIIYGIAIIGIAILLVLLYRIFIGSGLHRPSAVYTDVSTGVAFLQAQETKDPGAVDETLKERRRQELLAHYSELRKELEEDRADLWSLFDYSALLGDSRVVGFYYYGYLPESRVIAKSGESILNILSYVDTLKTIRPEYLFISYGMNDLVTYKDAAEQYASDLHDILVQLQEELPDTRLFVNSILPVKVPNAVELEALLEYAEENDTDAVDYYQLLHYQEQIEEFNAELKKMCDTYHYPFIDNTEITEQHRDLYEPDCIHLHRTFYPYWGKQMMLAAYDVMEQELNE